MLHTVIYNGYGILVVKMGGITNRNYTLECPVRFLAEQRTDMSPPKKLGKAKLLQAVTKQLYEQYCSGVAEAKNVLGAENSLQSWAVPSLGRNGV